MKQKTTLLQIFLILLCSINPSKNLSAKDKFFVKSNSTIYQDASIESITFSKKPNSHTFQLFSHGRPGELLLNGKWCNAEQIATFLQPKIQNSKFKIDNLNVYGCEFAKGTIGLQAVAYLQKTLGVSVSASTNITGKDGDWVLEVGKAKDVMAISNYKGNLQTGCTYGTAYDLQYPTSNTGTLPNYGTVANGVTGPPDQNGNIAGQNNNSSMEIVATFANVLTAGQTIYITGKWATNASYTEINGQGVNTGDKIFIEYSADNVTFTSTADYTPNFNKDTFTTAAFTIPATAPVGTKYVRIRGASATTYDYIDAIGVTMPRCANPPVSGVAYADNGTGGGTASNCVKDGSEDASTIPTGTYIKIRKTTDTVAISATSLPTNGAFTIPDVANGTYIIYLDDNNSLRDTAATNPLNFRGTISKTVTITNGVATPALNFCLKFLDTDGDGIGNDVDLDDDNDGVLDVVENACTTAKAIVPTSATESSSWTPASTTIGNIEMTGTGLTAVKDSAWDIANGFLMGSGETTGWIDYTFPAGTSLNAVSLWANTASQHNYGDAPLKDFQVQVTSGSGVWTSGVFSTTNPGLSAVGKAQIFDLGQTFTSVTKVRIKILNGWVDVNGDQSLYVPTYTTHADGTYNMELGEFRGVGGSCNGVVDTDGDGIPNSLDLDSDGDGCPDAVEAGTNLLTSTLPAPASMGIATGTANAVVTGAYGTNGFSNALETVVDNGKYKGSYTYNPYALNSAINFCTDSDGDGVPDYIDLDDDNDGILDDVENGCTVGATVAVSKTGALAGLGNTEYSNGVYTAAGIPVMLDGSLAGGQGIYNPTTNLNNATWFTVEFPTPHQLTSWEVENSYSFGLFDNTSTYKVQASNDATTWTDVSGTLTYNPTQTGQAGNAYSNIAPINATQPYKYYRYYGLSATAGGAWSYEFYFKEKAPCADKDTDGDGIPNRLDLDSDGDGCPDAIEGGAGLAASTLVTSTMPGGNAGGTYTGTSSSPVVKNLCNAPTCVGSTPATIGVPLVDSTGQSIGNSQNKLVQSANCPVCLAGTVAPAVTPTTASATCPATVNLTTLASTGSTPVGATKIWSTHKPPTTVSDTLTTAQASAVAVSGKYYTFFYDKVGACYSPADSVIVTITACISIKPTPDAGTSPATGGTAINNVAANDSVNGVPAVIGTNATVSTSGTWPAGITLNTATGKVSVAAGTAPGVYPVSYTLCDTATPTAHCTTVVDTVTVTAVIKPTPDAGSAPATGGTAINNVASNDSVNGVPAVIGTNATVATSGTWPVGVTLNTATGKVSVAAGTAPGVYPVSYTLCDTATPTAHCTTITDTVTVTAVIKPTPDAGTAPATGGTAIANVAANDSVNGVPAVIGTNATVSTSGTWPTGITLNTATGKVSVAAGTAPGVYPVSYTLCDTATPTAHCATITDTVTVTAVIKPTPDAGTAPATGGTAIANVAANDSVNGVPAVIGGNATVSTSGTWPTGITLNTATGKVSVAPGTPPGVYPVSYTLCDTATPTAHCATITDTVTVTAVIKPTPDAGTSPATGGTAINNVAANDSVNGVPAVIGTNATVSTSGTWPAGITLNTATGKVSVAAGTASGVYPVSYTLCDTATPTAHCTTVVDTVTVTAVIKPTPDAGSAPATGGTAINNVASNDSVNGVPAVIGTNATVATSGTWPVGVTLNTATGKVSVAAGTAPGVYPVSYTLCDTATPTAHCTTITDTVTVTAVIKPTPDAGTAPATGGTAIANVAANDSVNGVPAVIGTNATVSTSGTWPTGITLNTATGKVSVAAGTAPGVYPVSYTLCDTATPTAHCATITDTVTVTAVIKPTPDAGTATATGGTAIANVAANDSVNGHPAVIGTNATVSTSGTWPTGITLNTATGKVSVAAGTAPGVYPVSYTLCDTATPTAHCATVVDTVTVSPVIKPTPAAGTAPATGGTAIANIASNDSVNGHPAVIGTNATVSTSGTWPTGITLNTATGKVSVAPGTLAGIYPVSYTLCDTATPTPHCVTITDTVTVTATPDTLTVKPTCPSCPVKACVVANDITVSSTTTYTSCGLSASQASMGTLVLDLHGCLIWQGNGTQGLDTVKTCVVACNGTVCDTTYVNFPPAVPPYGSDTINVTPTCSTCPLAPICATGDDIPVGSTSPTYTLCGLTTPQSTLGALTIDGSGCAVWTPNGTLQTDTIKTCIIVCATPALGGTPVCDTTNIWIAPPPTPDYDTVTPACPTCPVTVCPVADDITITSATTFHNCGTPAGYTLTSGPSAAGCMVYTPDPANPPTADATTCVVACNGTVCDTTYVVIHPPKPIENPDVNATNINTPVNGSVNTNDVVPAGTTYGTPTASGSNPTGATITMNPDGTYTFNATLPGVYTYDVPVCAPAQAPPCPTTTLVITVTDPTKTTNVPIANTDLGTTKGTAPVTINSLANDASGNLGVPLKPNSVVVVTPPSHGSTSVNSTTGAITYTPSAGFVGKDTLYYSVTDSLGNTAIAMQIITVLPANAGNTTTASDDFGSGALNKPISGNALLNDIDPEGNTTQATPIDSTIPGVGHFVMDPDGSYTFTPVSGFSGPVNVPYSITDANGATASATIHLVVSPLTTPLAITFTNFTVANANCKSQLTWSVQNATEIDRFGIEKSKDAKQWLIIGNVLAQSNVTSYSYIDADMLTNAMVYYRIKEESKDGSSSYSDIESAVCASDIYTVKAYPNPVEDNLTISINRETGIAPEVYMFNAAGQRVQVQLQSNLNNKVITYTLSHLATGVYTVIVNDHSFGKTILKVVKK